MDERTLMEDLTKNEKKIYFYLKEKNEKSIKESFEFIQSQTETSSPTVHRAIKKLQSLGIISVVPSSKRSTPNEIIFHGMPDEEQEVDDIFKMVSFLNTNVNRFKTIIDQKTHEIEELQEQIQLLKKENEFLKEKDNNFNEKLVRIVDIDEQTKAYVVKT